MDRWEERIGRDTDAQERIPSAPRGDVSRPGGSRSCATGPPRRDCMAAKSRDRTMKSILSNPDWVHSFFIQVPYPVVHKLYESIVNQTKEGH